MPGASSTPPLPANCQFTFKPSQAGFYINFGGNVAKLPGYNVEIAQWTVPVNATFRTDNAEVSLQYNGSYWEQSEFSSAHYQSTTLKPGNTPQLVHGQVRFSWNSSTAQFQLCPSNGPGGLIVDGAMHQIPIDCLTLAQSATDSSNLNFFYAVNVDADNITVSGASDNGAGKVRLTVSDSRGNTGDQIGIDCVNIGGAIQANVRDTGKVIDTTHIDLLNTSSVGLGTYTSGGNCNVFRLAASTTGHSTFDNGVEVRSDDSHYTLVGIAYIGASNSVNDSATKRDVASWFNRRTETCVKSYTADRTWTSAAAWGEPSTEIRCEFVVFDDAHENAKTWSIAGMFDNSTPGDRTLVSAGFDPATMPVPEPEVVGQKGATMPLALRGAKSGLAEGFHTITLVAKTIGGGTSTILGTTSATSLEIGLWQ